MTINSSAWKRLPVADRDQEFNFDKAIARIDEWSGGDVDKFNSMFLWRTDGEDPKSRDSYRLPVGDIINGKAALVPHAIFTAASILSGAHGGLEDVINEKDREKLRDVVTVIYEKFQEMWGDPRTRPPWQRGMTKQERQAANATASVKASTEVDVDPETEDTPEDVTASVNAVGWTSLPIADTDYTWDSGPATARVFDWAEGDMGKYRKAFLWWDAEHPDLKSSYKLPIADVIDSELTIVPHAVNNASARLSSTDIPVEDKARIAVIIDRIQKRFHSDDETTAAYGDINLLQPPDSVFENPKLAGPTKLKATADNRVFGHIAEWGKCHQGHIMANRCVIPPHSGTNYKFFKNGEVLTASGSMRKVGKIVVDTFHAATNQGYTQTQRFYEKTGNVVALVDIYEDQFGPVVAGVRTPWATDEQWAMLRASPPSGHWIPIGSSNELVAVLGVNSPGFPVHELTASGELIATCMIGLDDEVSASCEPELNEAEQGLRERLDRLDAEASRILQSRRVRVYDRIMKLEKEGW